LEKLVSVFISQILGRIIGILAAVIMIYIFYPKTFKILFLAVILSAIKHIKRTEAFMKTKQAI